MKSTCVPLERSKKYRLDMAEKILSLIVLIKAAKPLKISWNLLWESFRTSNYTCKCQFSSLVARGVKKTYQPIKLLKPRKINWKHRTKRKNRFKNHKTHSIWFGCGFKNWNRVTEPDPLYLKGLNLLKKKEV